jgi:hypothetical protein
MTEKETEFALSAVNAGYEVLKDGWPDFLLVKGDEVIVVEVKNDKVYANSRGYKYAQWNPTKFLRVDQVRMLRLLEKAGLKVRIAYGSIDKLYTVDEYLKLSDYRAMVGGANTNCREPLKVVKIA